CIPPTTAENRRPLHQPATLAPPAAGAYVRRRAARPPPTLLPTPASHSAASASPTIPTGMPTQGIANRKMIPITSSAMPTPIMRRPVPHRTARETPRGSALHDDEAFLGHLANREGGAFLGVAGAFDAAVGHLVGAEGRRFVDGDAAELEPLGRGERGRDRGGEDACLQAVARHVGAL